MVIQSYNQVKEKGKIVQKCYTKVKGFLWGSAQSLHRASLTKAFRLHRFLTGETCSEIVRVTSERTPNKVLSDDLIW